MELRYSGGEPIVRCNKTEKRHLADTRDALRVLAHVEAPANDLVKYLDDLVNRVDEDGIVQPCRQATE